MFILPLRSTVVLCWPNMFVGYSEGDGVGDCDDVLVMVIMVLVSDSDGVPCDVGMVLVVCGVVMVLC